LPAQEHARYVDLIQQLMVAVQVQWPCLTLKVMQRPLASADGLETWMEVYDHPDGVAPELIQQLHDLALSLGLPAQRHSELFITLKTNTNIHSK
jgi:hypothetical protein